MKKSRFSEEQIIGFLRQAEAGMPIKELCRSGGFSDARFYKWRATYGGLQVSEAQREAIRIMVGQQHLSVLRRKKGTRPVNERVPLQLACTPNEVWSMDFVSDSLSGGRRLTYLTVAGDFSHESVEIVVDFGISGQYVTRVLDRAALFRGYPQAVRTDNGPEFTSRAFMARAQAHGIRHILIQPGRPMQNGYIESFNGKFRDEHLNESWFQTSQQAREAAATWRKDYNEVRPHSSLGRMPPARFAQLHRQRAGDAARSHSIQASIE